MEAQRMSAKLYYLTHSITRPFSMQPASAFATHWILMPERNITAHFIEPMLLLRTEMLPDGAKNALHSAAQSIMWFPRTETAFKALRLVKTTT
jgi:hypothetical protein